MTFDELDDSVGEQESTVDTVLGLDDEQADFDERMSEVEMRLEKASYYQLLLKNNPFDSDSALAYEVWKDISRVLRSRLAELLGIATPSVEVKSPFTEDEIKILKAVATKLKSKPGLMEAKASNKVPSLKRVTVPEDQPKPKMKIPTPTVSKAPAPTTGATFSKVVKGRKKIFKTVEVDGKKVQLDVTPQTQPQGGVKPLPMPDIQMSNAHAVVQAGQLTQGSSDTAAIAQIVTGAGN